MATDVTVEKKPGRNISDISIATKSRDIAKKVLNFISQRKSQLCKKIWLKNIGRKGAIAIVALETGFDFQKRSEESDSLVSMAIESRDMIA